MLIVPEPVGIHNISCSLSSLCPPRESITTRPTDRQTDIPSHRVATKDIALSQEFYEENHCHVIPH